jgi:1,4-alpha-glucan branching enzyme
VLFLQDRQPLATLRVWLCLCVLLLVSSALPQTVAEQQVTFTYTDVEAKAAFVAGEFKHWKTSATPMKRDHSGKWTAQVALRLGGHAYKLERSRLGLSDTNRP